jgi:anti-sigma B factor antagonist
VKIENLNLEDEIADGVLLVHAHGEIDHWSAPSLSERLRVAAHDEDGPVVVDLCDVTMIDSAGISVLVNAARRLVHQRRRMSIICPPGNLMRLFELTGLVDALEIHPTRAEALGALAEA